MAIVTQQCYSKIFQETVGMTGLYYDYTIPDNRTIDGLGHSIRGGYSKPHLLPFFRRYARLAVLLNQGTGLESIKYDPQNIENVFHFLMGVVSGYSPEDIDYFLNKRPKVPDTMDLYTYFNGGQKMSEHYKDIEGYKEAVYTSAILQKIQVEHYGWVTSLTTLKRILNHFNLPENWQPSDEELIKAEIKMLKDSYAIPIEQNPELMPQLLYVPS